MEPALGSKASLCTLKMESPLLANSSLEFFFPFHLISLKDAFRCLFSPIPHSPPLQHCFPFPRDCCWIMNYFKKELFKSCSPFHRWPVHSVLYCFSSLQNQVKQLVPRKVSGTFLQGADSVAWTFVPRCLLPPLLRPPWPLHHLCLQSIFTCFFQWHQGSRALLFHLDLSSKASHS